VYRHNKIDVKVISNFLIILNKIKIYNQVKVTFLIFQPIRSNNTYQIKFKSDNKYQDCYQIRIYKIVIPKTAINLEKMKEYTTGTSPQTKLKHTSMNSAVIISQLQKFQKWHHKHVKVNS